ncbi:hypothetical protein F2Q68_00038913 [Brassica cretica]|uniref:Uncharacterized protein n=1 Tax=Brassica cretica TaxID=69181 RepID=A0A8S9MQL1_BRACR|nr:hypothetical protein F2Q68_00038913 [Brassica cretica]
MLAPLDGRQVYSTNESTPQIKLIKQASSPINTQAMETKEASEVLRSPLSLKNILTLKISALTLFVILSTYSNISTDLPPTTEDDPSFHSPITSQYVIQHFKSLDHKYPNHKSVDHKSHEHKSHDHNSPEHTTTLNTSPGHNSPDHKFVDQNYPRYTSLILTSPNHQSHILKSHLSTSLDRTSADPTTPEYKEPVKPKPGPSVHAPHSRQPCSDTYDNSAHPNSPMHHLLFQGVEIFEPIGHDPHQSQRFSSTTTSKLNLAPNMEEQEAESGFVELSDYSSAEDTPMYRPSDEETHLASELFCCHDIPSLHSSLPFPSPSGTFSLLLCQHTSKCKSYYVTKILLNLT